MKSAIFTVAVSPNRYGLFQVPRTGVGVGLGVLVGLGVAVDVLVAVGVSAL